MSAENGNPPPEPGPQPAKGPEPAPLEKGGADGHSPDARFFAGRPQAHGLSGLSGEDLITLNEEIAGMARAGLPLDQGLAALAREMGRGRLQRVTAAIADDLKSGQTLPAALQRQGNRVPPFYASLVAAGVRTGRISEVLATLTVYARSLADLRSTVVGALFYPAVVLALAFVLFGFLLFAVVPQFEKIFADFKLKLPALTTLMIDISHHPVAVLVVPPAIIVLLLFAAWLSLRGTPRGRRGWARFVYALPIVGTLIRSARLAAFTDLLGLLVDSELPLPEAFALAGAASSDPIMADAAVQVHQDLSEGKPLGQVMRSRELVPELIAWMTALGEKRGTLGTTLHHVAQMYRRQAEMRATVLRSVLPPFIIIVTAGILVTMFVLAVSLPMLGLLEGLSGTKKG